MVLFLARTWPHKGLYLPTVVSSPNENRKSWGITRNPSKSPPLNENQDSEEQICWFFLISRGSGEEVPKISQKLVERWTWSWERALVGLQGARMKYLFLLYISQLYIQNISMCCSMAPEFFLIPHWFEGGFLFENLWFRVAYEEQRRKTRFVFV